MNPTVRTFSRAIETKFPEEDSVPKDLRPWWTDTRTNLDRLTDRVSDLEQGETVSPVTQTISSSTNIGDVDELFDPTSETYDQARIDFLSALHE